MRYANSERIPVIPRGSGSGMCGQVVPVMGGIILDMRGMNRILEINPRMAIAGWSRGWSMTTSTEPSNPTVSFIPRHPPPASLPPSAGEIANNASGGRSVKYGAARDPSSP